MIRRVALVDVAVLVAVTPSVADAQAPAWRDSAGVRIIEVSASHLSALPLWTIEGPTMRIGDVAGDPNYEFNRAGAAWRFRDGGIVVANEQIELRFFDAQGRYLRTVGRRGKGPGEYEQLFSLWRAQGDSLLIYDVPTSRIDVRTEDGSLVRSFTIPRTTQLAWLPDGGAVYAGYAIPDLRTPGIKQDSLVFRRLRPDGQPADTVAVLPGGWTEILVGGNNWRGVELAGTPMVWGGVGGAVFVHGDRLSVHWFAPDGHLAALTRVGLPRIRVTGADIRANEAAKVATRASRPRLGVEGNPLPPSYAQFLPQATRVRLDSEGRAWVRRWPASPAALTEWIVFAPRGLPIARINMPARLVVHDIGSDYLVGVAVDDDGVQSVQVYRIRH